MKDLPPMASQHGGHLAPGRVEIRHDERGQLDEIVGASVCVHLEYMDDNTVWIGIYGTDGRETRVTLHARGKIRAVLIESDGVLHA